MFDDAQEYIDEQAYSWLEMHKKSALTYLVLYALSQQDMWSKSLTEWMHRKTEWVVSERALYRVLRRLEKQGSITHTSQAAERTGAERKVYRLTSDGAVLLYALRKEMNYMHKLDIKD